MNIRVKAAAIVVGITAGTLVGISAIHAAATYIGPENTLKVLGFGVLAFLFYQMYTLVVEHLERNERLKEMSDRG
jgi:hypothetical protein